MDGNVRRNELLKILEESKIPVSGGELSKIFNVSRQIIVQDIALLRAAKKDIISTNRGYIIRKPEIYKKIFKVRHNDQQIEDELTTIVDLGGIVEDVFVYHKVYGVIQVDMGIKSRKDVFEFMENLKKGISTPLKKITDDYHYHTVAAESKELLTIIEKELRSKGFIAVLRNHEPFEFVSK